MVNLVWLLAQASENPTVPSPEDQLWQWLSNVPGLVWLIVIVLFVGSIFQSIDAIKDWSIRVFGKLRPKKQEITDEQRQKLRRQLIGVVLGQVVNRLEGSLHHKIRLDLKRREERQRVGRRDVLSVDDLDSPDQFIHREFNPFDSPSLPSPVDPNLSTYDLLVRDDIKGRLLILGEPGSGKTNELLAVAKALLQEAQQSSDHPIPVIFELSEWSSNNETTFADWLSDQLKEKYNVSPDVSKHWIEQNQLFPLLDGLDELRRVETAADEEMDRKRQAKQIQCMRTINAFLDVHPAMSMLVCCRRKEYETLQTQGEYLKRLNGAIYLQALDDAQIQNYFKDSNRGPLWDILRNQPKLLELARSPLFLLMFVVAYQGQPIQTTEELLDLYIEKQLDDLNNQEAYPLRKSPSPEKTHHYLSWLAVKLEKEGVTEFLIERLQPYWLDQERDLKRYSVLVRLAVMLIFGLSLGLSFGLSLGLNYGLSYGLIAVLSLGLIAGLVGTLLGVLVGSLIFGLLDTLLGGVNRIQSAESLSLSWQSALRVGLLGGLLVGLGVGLLGALIVGLNVGLSVGLRSGLVVGLIGFLSIGLIVSEFDIDEKRAPNQGIKNSIKSFMIVGLSFGLVVGLVGRLGGGLGGLFIGLGVGLSGSLRSGLGAVIQHSSLRLVLHQSGVAPWNYARFLAHAENHRFIQRTGGRYRFVHALLRKRFAELYQPRYR